MKQARKEPPPAVRWWYPALILGAGLLSYANSGSGPFILDDAATIVDNVSIRRLGQLGDVLVPRMNTAVAGRPLVNLSFAINYAFGGLAVGGYHAFNIASHLACALLLFALARRTFELPRVRPWVTSRPEHLALAVALLWTVHPLNSEVVDYVTQRTESLMALFFLLTLYASVRAFDQRHAVIWGVVATVSTIAGVACKESMGTVPVVLALYDRVYVFDSWKAVIRKRGTLYSGLLLGWVVLAIVVSSGPRAAVVGLSSGVSPWTYLLNQTVMIARYLRLSIWPDSLVAFYGWPQPLTIGDVLPYGVLIVGLLVITVWALVRAPMIGFLGAWFFITLAPASSVIPVATEVGAERRMYLPLVAVATLIVVAGDFLRRRAMQSAAGDRGRSETAERKAFVTAGVVLMIATVSLSAATFKRNREYESTLTLARTVVERRPTAVAHHILGEQFMIASRHDEAITHLREAVRGGDSRAAYVLGLELIQQGKRMEGIGNLETFIRTWRLPYHLVPRWLEPNDAEILNARGAMAHAYELEQQWSRAAEQAELMLRIAPSSIDARGILSNALFAQERYDEARERYADYLARRPNDVRALSNYGVCLVAADRLAAAVEVFRRAVAIEPMNVAPRRLLAMALLDRGDREGAVREAREAATLSPDDPLIREVLRGASQR